MGRTQTAARRSESFVPETRRRGLEVERKPLPAQLLLTGEEANKNAFLRDVGWTVLRISRIDGCSGFPRTFPIFQHAHNVLGNIHTDRTTEGMIIKANVACLIHIRDIAV